MIRDMFVTMANSSLSRRSSSQLTILPWFLNASMMTRRRSCQITSILPLIFCQFYFTRFTCPLSGCNPRLDHILVNSSSSSAASSRTGMFWGIGLSSSSGTFLFSGSPVSSPSTASSKSSAASSRSSAAPSRSSSPSSPELSEASEDASPGVHSSTSSSSSYEDETVIISTGAFMISVDLSEINNASNSNSVSLSPSII